MRNHGLRVRLAVVLSAGVLVFGLGACASSKSTKACCSSCGRSSTPSENLAGQIVGEWALLAIDGQAVDGSAGVIAAGRPPTLRIDSDGRISGFGGVNRYGGGVDAGALVRGEFMAGPIAATKMAGPPEAMDLEHRVFGALERAKRFRVMRCEQSAGSTLELIDESGVVVLSFRRVSGE